MAAVPDDLPSRLDRSHELVYVQLAFLLVAGLSVLVRLYVKAVLVKHHSLDDYLIYGALVRVSLSLSLCHPSAIHSRH